MFALPYVLLGVAFTQMLQSEGPRVLSLLLLAMAAVIAGAPAFLAATRTLETVAARALREVDLPDPVTDSIELETRLRSALWFTVHLTCGAAVRLGMVVAVPMAVAFLTSQFRLGSGVLDGLELGPLGEDDVVVMLGIVTLVGMAYAVAGLGRLAAIMAHVLLGPSPAERIGALEAEADQLVERNRLARELHDSFGHALTVTVKVLISVTATRSQQRHGPRRPRTVGHRRAPILFYGLHVRPRTFLSMCDPQRVVSNSAEAVASYRANVTAAEG